MTSRDSSGKILPSPRPPAPFAVGQRVQLHPATDWFMRGCRYATVVRLTRKPYIVVVRFDRLILERKINVRNIEAI